MTELEKELLETLKFAEAALVNCIPVIPYRGDGPLVRIRKVIAKAESQQKRGEG